MRKLLIGLMFACGIAHADNLAFLKNQAGGYMYFTDTYCKGSTTSRVVYTNTSDGSAFYGCWFYLDGMVHVQWNNGKNSAFPAQNLTINNNRQSL